MRAYTWKSLPITWRNRRSGHTKLKIKEIGSGYVLTCLSIWLEKCLSRGKYRVSRSRTSKGPVTKGPPLFCPFRANVIVVIAPKALPWATFVSGFQPAKQELGQQRSDESAFLRQKRFGSEEARVVPGAFFVAVGGQNCRAHRERARRLDAGYPRLADCG